jgi:hypothetical protein
MRHDSVLYLGQALLRAKPDVFGKDLFFAYGSQAQFTVFPQLLGWILGYVDAARLFLSLTLFGLILFTVASAILAWQLLPVHNRLWGLLAVLVMPSMYGGLHIFSYLEQFATGRTVAEPLTLLALAAFLRQRWIITFLLWLAAALIHPLQALPALLFVWVYLVYQDRRWLKALWLVGLGLLLALVGITPFSKLLLQYDPQWLEGVREANKHIFLSLWEFNDWCYLLTDLFLVWLTMCSADGLLKPVCRALLCATLAALAASALLVDVLHLVWFAGLQIWRMHWLLHWLAMASLPFLLYRLYAEGQVARPRLLLLLAIAALGASVSTAISPGAVLILIPLFLIYPRIETKISPIMKRVLKAAILLTLLLACAKHVLHSFHRFANVDRNWNMLHIDLALLAYPLFMGTLIAAGVWLWGRSIQARGIIMLVLGAWLAYATLFWDRRSDWTLAIENAAANESVFGVRLRPGAQIFWENELVAPWIVLQRPSYLNNNQTAGLLFNRGTAEQARIRQNVLSVLEIQTQLCGVMNTLNRSNNSCLIDETAVRDACEASEGGLDYLVLRNPLKSHTLGSWTALPGQGQRPVTYYLYQCNDFSVQAKARQQTSDKSYTPNQKGSS